MLLILTFIYICIQLGFKYFGNGHLVEYEVKNGAVEATVREKFVTRTKDERDNYYFDILIGKQAFSFQTFLNFKKYDHVLTNLYYYEDEQYACIYPIFKIHTQVTDVLCKDQSGMIRYYHDMKNDNASLTAFVQELSKNNLYKNMWQDRLEKTEEALHVVLYNENIVDGHYLGVDHYSGLYLVNNYSNRQLFNTIVFNKDYYDKPLSAQVGKYVIVADYGSTYDFDTFHFVDLVYNQKDTIRYHSKFSFSSYFQGSVDHSIYLFDPEAKKQYEIDLKAKEY